MKEFVSKHPVLAVVGSLTAGIFLGAWLANNIGWSKPSPKYFINGGKADNGGPQKPITVSK